MTIKTFDRDNLKMLRKEIDAALAVVGAKHGINISLGSARFNANTFSTKIEGALVNQATGEVLSRTVENLKLYGKMYLGDKFDSEKTYIHPLERYEMKFIGFHAKRSKYPFEFKNLKTGKVYLMPTETAKIIVNS